MSRTPRRSANANLAKTIGTAVKAVGIVPTAFVLGSGTGFMMNDVGGLNGLPTFNVW